MDGPVAERLLERLVDSAVLVEEGQAVELPRGECDLEVVARSRPVLDGELDRVGECLLEGGPDRIGLHRGHASDVRRDDARAEEAATRGYARSVRIVKRVGLVAAGIFVGLVGAGVVMRKILPSSGDETSDELALAAVLRGIELRSRATAFGGGSLVAWLGGIAVDLRETQHAPGAGLRVQSILGGIAIRVPAGWRVESSVTGLGGGVAIDVPEPDAADAPVLRLSGFALLGGIAVAARPAETASAP